MPASTATALTMLGQIPYIAVASSLEQFNVNAARPYVSFVSYFRNDGYTSDFDLRVRRATSFLVRQLQRAEIDSRAHPGRVESAVRPAADHRIPGPVAAGRLRAGTRRHRRPRTPREVHRLAGIRHEPRCRGQCRAAARRRPLRLAEGVGYLPVERDHRHHRAAGPARERPVPLRPLRCHAVRPRSCATSATTALLSRLESLDSTRYSHIPNPPQWYIRELHTNACGDFLLMSRTMWRTVRGFPLDNTVLSLDCDLLIMHAAVALGRTRSACRRPAASSRAATTACSATASATSGRRCSPRSTSS